jgi:putative hydrolase of HD superfamily
MKQTRLGRQVGFILEADKLKEVFRQTLCTQSLRRENDAEHSWHLCLAAIVLAGCANARRIDVLRVLKMLVIHDLVEIDAGDTFAYDTARMAGQHEREAVAADRIFGLLPRDQAREFRGLWDEFEERRSAEAKFAAAIDRFQPCLLNCKTRAAAWKRHGVTEDRVIARNSPIAEGSKALWRQTLAMIRKAADSGDLSRAKGPAKVSPGPGSSRTPGRRAAGRSARSSRR